ncbi:MAG: hypothetical protein IT291_09195 [Deltaproteobacteria bacterium]|nr:hypothetical protein [Deltaproteobacteria bacterium]
MKLWSNSTTQHSTNSFNPERRLLAAVLQRAITDYLTGEGELQESAYEWLYKSDELHHTSFFGFRYVCEALDFHGDELRKAIKRQFEEAQRSDSTLKALIQHHNNTEAA